MKFTLEKAFGQNGIILAKFKTQYDLTSTLVRIQEFYESDSSLFKDKYFTMDDYMDYYAHKHGGKFTYFTDWNGFNLKDSTIAAWKEKFAPGGFRPKESEFLRALDDFLDGRVYYYLIAMHDEENGKDKREVLLHEMSHALYTMDMTYHSKMWDRVQELDPRVKYRLETFLEKKGYGKEVHNDEMIAYLATASDTYLKNDIGIGPPAAKAFRDLFNSTLGAVAKAPAVKAPQTRVGACVWKYQDGQFAGGPFMLSSCGEAYPVKKRLPRVCPNCHQPVEES